MADENVRETQSLQPAEYLQWVQSLERAGGVPDGARAYLVTLNGGIRKVQPVGEGESVLHVERDLFAHLAAQPRDCEFLQRLRAFADKELALAGQGVSFTDERVTLALRAAWQIESIAEQVHELVIDDDTERPAHAAKALLRRVRRLANAQMAALNDPREETEDIADQIENG